MHSLQRVVNRIIDNFDIRSPAVSREALKTSTFPTQQQNTGHFRSWLIPRAPSRRSARPKRPKNPTYIMTSHFKKIPFNGSAVFGALDYQLELDTEAEVIDLQIINAATSASLGELRYYQTRTAACDIAPYLAHLGRRQPAVIRTTGVSEAEDTTIRIVVKAAYRTQGTKPDSPTMFHEEQSAERTFVLSHHPLFTAEMLTPLPRQRILGNRETDEILVYTLTSEQVRIVAEGRRNPAEMKFTIPRHGIYRIVVNAAEFPDAERLTVEAGEIGRVEYTVVRRPRGSVRMAWLSPWGGIERYTFPHAEEIRCKASRSGVKTAEGQVMEVRTQKEYTLRTAFENRATMEALAEVIASGRVWIDDGAGRFQRMEVLSDELPIHRHGALAYGDLTLCLPAKTPARWN